MTQEQRTLREAVFADKSGVNRLIEGVSTKIRTATTGAEIGRLRLMRAAIRAIAAARWGVGWQTN